jgi:hypothetical protein
MFFSNYRWLFEIGFVLPKGHRTSPMTILGKNVYDCYICHRAENFMASTVLSVRIPAQGATRLFEPLHQASQAYLATEALGDYVKKNAWPAKELHEAISEADTRASSCQTTR